MKEWAGIIAAAEVELSSDFTKINRMKIDVNLTSHAYGMAGFKLIRVVFNIGVSAWMLKHHR